MVVGRDASPVHLRRQGCGRLRVPDQASSSRKAIMKSDVFVVRTRPSYPEYPYSPHDELAGALRTLFSLWGRNPDNPFGDWAWPGATVVIKPNWVLHHNYRVPGVDALVTHSSLISYLLRHL